jgi:hypothetical protein
VASEKKLDNQNVFLALKEEQTTQWSKEKEEQKTQWSKEKEEQTTQWSKEKEEQTTQWSKEKEEQTTQKLDNQNVFLALAATLNFQKLPYTCNYN